MTHLTNKVAFVTGAAGGIGAAIVRRFAQDGATVIATDIARALDQIPTEAAVRLALDVSDENAWTQTLQAALQHHQRIDIMASVAGVFPPPTEIADMRLEDWDRVMDINSSGSFLALRTMIPHMIGAGGGSIVMIASLAAMLGGSSFGAYAASKGAVRSLGMSAAVRYGPQSVRVNTIFPGLIETPMTAGEKLELLRAIFLEQQPIKRIGQPEDVAKAAAFLASDDASFITAAELIVDGGWSVR